MKRIVSILALAIACRAVPVEVNNESNRISGGTFAANLQFPYAVSIQYITNNQNSTTRGHRCGGALITLQHVLTVASCMYERATDGNINSISIANYRVFAGANLLTNDTSADRIRTIAQYAVHPDYLGIPSYLNDIAVVTLTTPFLTSTVVPIALPSETYQPAVDTTCTIVGWGASNFLSAGAASTEQKFTSKYIYDQNLCTLVYSAQPNQPNIRNTMVCAASNDIVSAGCLSDEGNPLVCENTFTGVLALHANCGATSFPEIYTRVSNYTTWIRSITGSANTFYPGATVVVFLTLMQMAFANLLR